MKKDKQQKHQKKQQNIRFRDASAVVATWADVVQVMDGKPYRLYRMAKVPLGVMDVAKKRGFFSEAIARRIHAATCGRLPLISKQDYLQGL